MTFGKIVNITITTVPAKMIYDITHFKVNLGDTVNLTLKNIDEMQHNLIICDQGEETWKTVAQETLLMGAKMFDKKLIPDSKLVLHATDLVNPHQSDTITFKAPTITGNYPYVCTMPGHAMLMRGVMQVGDAKMKLTDGTYKYYEGTWSKLPNFAALTPVSQGALKDNIVSLTYAKRKENYGFQFDSKLHLQDGGTSIFYLSGDDGVKLYVNDTLVIEDDGLHPPTKKRGTIALTPGIHTIKIEYFQAGGGSALTCNMFNENKQNLSITQADAKSEFYPTIDYNINITHMPQVVRGNLPNCSPRSMAVGLPSQTHFCFDAATCQIAYAWIGEFLNTGPTRGYGTGRGGKNSEIVGQLINIGSPSTLAIGTGDQQIEWLGYTMPTMQHHGHSHHGGHHHDMAPTVPTFNYRINDIDVKQTIITMGKKVSMKYVLSNAPKENVTIAFNDKQIKVKCTKGRITNNTLTIQGKYAKRFTVVIEGK